MSEYTVGAVATESIHEAVRLAQEASTDGEAHITVVLQKGSCGYPGSCVNIASFRAGKLQQGTLGFYDAHHATE